MYDYERMAEHLMDNDGMTYEEAVEFIDYNTVSACPYMPNHPIILVSIDDYIDYAEHDKAQSQTHDQSVISS